MRRQIVFPKKAFRRCQTALFGQKQFSLQQYINNPDNYLVSGDYIPRENWQINQSAGVDQDDSADIFSDHVSSLINDIEDDPHLKHDLSCLSQVIINSGFDIRYNVTTSSYKPDHLIVCGTGSGKELIQIIDYLQPRNLSIIVSEWEDWVSSFFEIDWLEIWNKYCSDDALNIYAAQSIHPESLIQTLAFKYSLTLDHAMLYVDENSSKKTVEIHQKLKSGLADRAIGYTGFSMDEYNMLVNSWRSLQISPRVYRPKNLIRRSGTYAVIGSGPSLDDCLPILKQIQNKVTIICCASNYGTLRKAGINVDILCLLERGEFMVDQYQQILDECGSSNTKLIASVTTPYQLHEQFSDSMIYFRPSLTPISIFAEDPTQVLPNEGPQTVNTGVSFALNQHPERIILFGVDLGTSSTSKVRSDQAIGESPRDFPIEYKGNLRKVVFTNELLMDGIRVLEGCALFNSSEVDLINCSDGVFIDGFKSMKPSSILSCMEDFSPSSTFDAWWSGCSRYSFEMFEASFNAAKPRSYINTSLNELAKVIKLYLNHDSYYVFKQKVTHLLDLEGKTRYQQLCSRMIRGNMYRILISINRQLIIMNNAPEHQINSFILGCQNLLLNRVSQYKKEIFQLLDMLESENNKSRA